MKSPEDKPPRAGTIVALALAVGMAALAVRLIHFDRGMWGDEFTTYWVSHLRPSRIVEERLAHNHLPTYFIMMHFWVKAFGTSLLSLRLPSILPGALAVAGLFLIGARRFPLKVSLLAATLFALNANHIFVSQAIRMYGLLVLLEVVFVACLLRDLRRPSPRIFLVYSAVVLFGCSVHLLFLRMAAIAAALIAWEWLACARRVRRSVGQGDVAEPGRECGGANGIVPGPALQDLGRSLFRHLAPFLAGALWLPVASSHFGLFQDEHCPSAEISWLDKASSPLPWRDREEVFRTVFRRGKVANPVKPLAEIVLGSFESWGFLQKGWPKTLLRLVALGVGGIAVWAAFRRRGEKAPESRDRWRTVRLSLLWATLPTLVLFFADIFSNRVLPLQPRWLVGSSAGWAIVIACGVARLSRWPWARRSVGLVAIALSAFFSAGWLKHPGDGFPEAIRFWSSQGSPGEKVFLAHRGYWETAMQFEGMPLPPEPLRSGIVLEEKAVDLARRLREVAGGDRRLWFFHCYILPASVVNEAFGLLAPSWRCERVFAYSQCAIYRLSRISDGD